MSDFSIRLDEKDYRYIMDRLEELETVDQRQAISKGLKEGAERIINPGKANLAGRNKVRTGNLKRSFGKRVNNKKKGIYAGFRRPKGAVAHLVDRGTVERYTKSGAYRGKITGSFFWTDAVDQHGQEAIEVIMDTIIDEIEKIVG